MQGLDARHQELIDTVVHVGEAMQFMENACGKTHRRGYIINAGYQMVDYERRMVQLTVMQTRTATHIVTYDSDLKPLKEHPIYEAVGMRSIWAIPFVN